MVLLGGFFVGVDQAGATGCSQDIPFEYNPVPNSVFANYESVEYINGYLVVHFKLNRQIGFNESWSPSFVYVDDQCRTWDRGGFSRLSNPENVSSLNLSLRFTSPTHFEFWNDDTNARFVCGSCQGDILDIGEFFKIRFHFLARDGIGTIGEFTSSAHNIKENASPPPILVGTIPATSGCPVFTVTNGIVDDYEQAEYVNGKLRIHFRRMFVQDGSAFGLKIRSYGPGCTNPQTVSYIFQYAPQPFIEYFSVRFTDSSHFELWDDDNERLMNCNDGGQIVCSGYMYPVPLGGFVTAGVSIANSRWQASMTSTAFSFSEPPPIPTGHSSVVFLPGLEASRLYRQDTLFENQLWEPNRHQDIQDLFLNENGQSIIADIYTRDVIDEVNVAPVGQGNIYKSFINTMDGLVDDGTIAEWKALPYDWRFDLPDIVASARMIDEIEAMAAASDTGKVTIIAHSHGGLVAKQLIYELEARGKADLVDKLILVAVPQMGTPKALEALLHGEDVSWIKGFVTPRWITRELAEHMQSAFNLLPTEGYFAKVADPVIEFDTEAISTAVYRGAYGDRIASAFAMRNFLTGNGDRVEPDERDITKPNALLTSFVDRSATRAGEQDTWTPPADLKVFQIAGWGLETLRGIKYTDRIKETCDSSLTYCTKTHVLDQRPLVTTDGDKTVISYSADKMEGERWYVDLYEYNKIFASKINRDHGDILEVQDGLNAISKIISSGQVIETNLFMKSKPVHEKIERRLSVHSPVSIDVYDSAGNHTGLKTNTNPDSDIELLDEQIPNSQYFEFGEGKYISVPDGETYDVIIKGTGLGEFDFELEQGTDGNYIGGPIWNDIPVNPKTVATITIGDSAPVLALDVDGDGTIDANIPEGYTLSAASLLDILEYNIKQLTLSSRLQRRFDRKITLVRGSITKEQITNAQRRLDSLTKDIKNYVTKKYITFEQGEVLMGLINQIKLAIK